MTQTAALDDLCELITDGTHYTPPDVGHGFPFLTVKDMNSTGLDFRNCSRIAKAEFFKAREQNSAPKSGDILFSKDGTVGKVYVVSEAKEFAVLSSIAILRPKKDLLDSNFAAHYLRSPKALSAATQRKTGSALTRIILRDLKQIHVPILPLEEQKRIAAILDQADDIRRKRQHAIERLNQLGQAIFYEMFGDIDDGRVSVAQLGDLTSKIGSGATPKGGDSAYKAEGIPLVRSMNVRDGKFSSKGLAFIDEHQASKLDNVVVQANDVLLNITGASVARVCLAPAEMAGARVNQHVSIIRLNRALTSEFLEAFLLMPRTKATLLAVAEAGATRQAITKTQIESLAVPLPSQTQQQEFTDRLRMAKQSLGGMIDQSSAYGILFASLQHRAFAGEL